jgi:hypothetical protein
MFVWAASQAETAGFKSAAGARMAVARHAKLESKSLRYMFIIQMSAYSGAS